MRAPIVGGGSPEADAAVAPPILVSDAPPTASQRCAAWGSLVLLGIGFAAALPVYGVDLAIVAACVPVVRAVVCMASISAAAFLFSQYAVRPQPGLLAL